MESEVSEERRTPILAMHDIHKSFGAVVALDHADLELYGGEIHALIGENGAGKSTLVKIMAGVHRRDRGDFFFKGEQRDFHSTHESKEAGISVIYQEPTLFPDLSVTENIFMGRRYVDSFGQVDRKRMRAEVVQLFERLGANIDPDRHTLGLSIADQQLIEIAKAISLDSRVLVMDEPTAALSGVEVERLFATARVLRDEGRALVFISHRLDEVFNLCDTITVMRDGNYVDTFRAAEITEDELIRHMVGRDVTALFPKTEGNKPGEVVLKVEGLSSTGLFDDISLEIREGEIVGLAGLVGAGRSEVVRAVFGVDAYDSGTVWMDGKKLAPRNPRRAIAAGIAMVPEDRRQQGLHMEASISRNITLILRDSLSRLGLLTSAMEDGPASEWGGRLQVKARDVDATGSMLSGGNQQKVVIGKALMTGPKVLLMDEPSRGIDVGAKADVFRTMRRLAGEGLAILFSTSDLEEVMALSDRIAVMSNGRLVTVVDRKDATEDMIVSASAEGHKTKRMHA